MTFCTSPPEVVLTDQAKVGDRLLVIGSEDLNNPLHIVTNGGFLFPVEGGMIHPPSPTRFPHYRDEPVMLRELSKRLTP